VKTLVTYYTDTGNTKKVAEAIYEALGGKKEIKSLKDVDNLKAYDLVFIGSPMHGFGLCEDVKKFLEKHSAGKNIALFVTHAAPEGGEMLEGWLGTCKKSAAGANLVGFFNCQGEMSKLLADEMMKLDDPLAVRWGKQRYITLGQPDAERLERAAAFAREILEKM
jgi:flavodoxin